MCFHGSLAVYVFHGSSIIIFVKWSIPQDLDVVRVHSIDKVIMAILETFYMAHTQIVQSTAYQVLVMRKIGQHPLQMAFHIKHLVGISLFEKV